MAQKKYIKHAATYAAIALLALQFGNAALAEEENQSNVRSVELTSSEEFTFAQRDTSAFTIRPLKPELRAIENLKNTEAVGVIYLGDIVLSKNATPLSALRNLSVQISNGLDIDLALITDSTTSQSLAPHELLLLYHPELVVTLALTEVTQEQTAIENNEAAENEEVESDNTETSEESSEVVTIRGQYSLIGTYAIPAKPLPELIPPSEETTE